MRDSEQRTPIHLAAEWKRTEVVELLLKNQADISAGQFQLIQSPIHLVAF